MSLGGWTTAQGTEVGGGGDYRPHGAYVLRPLSLGEILDRSFAVYRANFWLFVGIAVLSSAVQLVANAVLLLIYKGYIPNPRTQPNPFHIYFGGQQIGSVIAEPAEAARPHVNLTAPAVSARKPTTISAPAARAACASARSRWTPCHAGTRSRSRTRRTTGSAATAR